MTEGANSEDPPTLSIGAVSKAADIPPETLRTWERRYGYPSPGRNGAGHRAYRVETIGRLKLISAAIDAGHRPGQVVDQDDKTLRSLLDASRLDDAATDASGWADRWLDAAAKFDGDTLEKQFYVGWSQLGAMDFLTDRVGPFLRAVGRAWAAGAMTVAHEHFTSERLRDFLSRHWRPVSDRADGPCVVLATLPGEHHDIGLHMAAVVLALGGCRVSFVGADTPLDEIAAASDQQDASAVLVSVSQAFDKSRARGMLDALSASIEPRARLVVGGSGRPPAAGQEVHIEDWRALYGWARQLTQHRP